MKIRSKAPLRIGLAGGGTDVSPYSDLYNGAILNATIDLYAYCTIIPRHDNRIIFKTLDSENETAHQAINKLKIDGNLDLQKGIYNRIVKEFNNNLPLSFEMTTSIDVPSGSGLGSSSTLAVAIIGAYVEWLKIPLGKYEIAQLAYQIEREDLKMTGGKQDQYAATFGGFNFMEFLADNKVIVNPLQLKKEVIDELNLNLLLYFTSTRRKSALIIDEQVKNTQSKNIVAIEAMHQIKKQAFDMKEALLKLQLDQIGHILDASWESKKKMAKGISNNSINTIYNKVKKAGVIGGKISGAGGGGFMILYCSDESKYAVKQTLRTFDGNITHFQFTTEGVTSWTID